MPELPSPLHRIRDGLQRGSTQARIAAATLAERADPVWNHRFVGPVLKLGLLYLVIVELAVQGFFGRVELFGLSVGLQDSAVPRSVFLYGATVGALYGLIAVGLILVYRANRIINFAQAQLGAVAGVIGLLLISAHDWPYLAVLPIVLLGGILLGAGVEAGVIRRFHGSSRLILTVVTIGVGFLLLVLEFLAKHVLVNVLTDDGLLEHVVGFPTPFDRFEFTIDKVVFLGDHIVTVVVGLATIIGLTLFLRRTRVGVAIRAAAENRDRAALLGIPVARLWTIVWALAALLSAVAAFLRGPLVGMPIGGFVGPLLLLYGLAAAVIARMDKFSTAMIAGMFIGMVDYTSVFATSTSDFAAATMLAVVVGALVLRRQRTSRALESGVASWQTAHELRAIPTELRSLPVVRNSRRVFYGLVALFALALPWVVGSSRVGHVSQAVIYAIVGVSLVVLTGWAGQISLGQFGFAGVGAAVAGLLVVDHQVDFFLAVIAAGLVGAVVAVLIGLPALRIQGLFLAVVTLAFAFTVPNLLLDQEYFGWLLPGSAGDLVTITPPVLYGRVDLAASSELFGVTVSGPAKFYWLTLAFLLLAMGMAYALRRYRSGRVFVATRDNVQLVQAFGVSPASTRLAAFAISGFLAAMAGGLFVFSLGSVVRTAFPASLSIQLFVMTVIGGITSISGAILGAVFLQAIPVLGLDRIPVIGQVIDILGTGLGILMILYFLPGGLAEGVHRIRDHLLRWLADRRGIVVPSLVADVRVEEGTSEEDADHLPALAATGGEV